MVTNSNLTKGGYIATPNANVTPAQVAAAQASGWAPTSTPTPTGGTVYQGGSMMPAIAQTTPTVAPTPAPIAPKPTIAPVGVLPTNDPSLGTPAQGTPYAGNSIVDALNSQGAPSSFADRAKLAQQQGIAGYTGTSEQNNQLLNKFKQALPALQAGGQSPDNAGAASSAIQKATQAVGQENTSPGLLGSVMETDSNFDSIFTEYDKFHSPIEQHKSLVDEYKSLSDSLGINKINTDLLNAQKVIDGTEDDIRMEVEKAGGFATDSQVVALSNSRNKSLIKNYNYLLASRDNAMTQLNTMMNLTIQDRQMAEAEFDRKMNFAFKVADYKQKAMSNAAEGLNNFVTNVGYDGLLNSLGNNQAAQTRTEKLLGIAPGGLVMAAQLSAQDRARNVAKENLQLDVLKSNLKTDAMQRSNIQSQINERNSKGGGSEAPTVKSINGVDMQWNPTSKKWESISAGNSNNELKLSQTQSSISQISDLTKDPAIRSVVGPTGIARLIGGGLDRATGSRQNFIAGVEQLRSTLNLDTLIKAKAQGATFGALSNQELQVLSSSATKIGSWANTDSNGKVKSYSANEKTFKAELDKINNFAKLDFILKGGDPTSVQVQIMPDGTYWTKNSDGSLTQLR